MRNRTRMAITAGVLLAACALLAGWWPRSHERASTHSRDAAEAATTSARPLQSTSATPREATQGRGGVAPIPNLHDALQQQFNATGSASAVSQDLLSLATGACVLVRDIRPDDQRRRNPRHAWAIVRHEQACVGWDIDDYAIENGAWVKAYAAARRAGPEATKAWSLDRLRRADSTSELAMAVNALSHGDALPLDYDRTLDDSERMQAMEYATWPVRCEGLGGCGPGSLLASFICMQDGCMPNATYEQAMMQRLSPRERDSALRMRSSFLRLRATP